MGREVLCLERVLQDVAGEGNGNRCYRACLYGQGLSRFKRPETRGVGVEKNAIIQTGAFAFPALD